jgi:hypothetical protein
MSGTGLDFPITTKYLHDSEEATLEKNSTQFSSSTSLNRTNSLDSQWTTATELARSNTIESEKHHSLNRLTVDITPLQPLKTKPSSNTIGSNRSLTPATPGSILTFASTATTLVDFHHLSANKSAANKSSYPYPEYDHSMTYR